MCSGWDLCCSVVKTCKKHYYTRTSSLLTFLSLYHFCLILVWLWIITANANVATDVGSNPPRHRGIWVSWGIFEKSTEKLSYLAVKTCWTKDDQRKLTLKVSSITNKNNFFDIWNARLVMASPRRHILGKVKFHCHLLCAKRAAQKEDFFLYAHNTKHMHVLNIVQKLRNANEKTIIFLLKGSVNR